MAGWPIVGWSALAIGAMCAAIAVVAGTEEAGVRMAVRATARTSLALFLAVFVASSLRRVWRSDASAWLLRNRRYLGVSFAVSMGYHGLALYALAGIPDSGFTLELSTLVGGGLAYVFTLVLAATSSDRAVAWLGRRRWRALHTTGVYYVSFIFAVTLVPVTLQSPLHALMNAALLTAFALRAAVAWRTRGDAAATA